MNQFQKRHHRQESRRAAEGYVPPADCIGKTFAFGSCHYEVIQYNPERWTFTLSIINHGNAHIEKDEAFVRHHCTPPVPRELPPSRREQPRYFQFPALIISDKTDIGAVVDHPADAVGDKMLDTELADVQLNITLETDEPLDPAYYLDQKFDWTPEGGKTYTVTVQAWNERRQQFRLYAPGGAPWYREPAFVHQRCQPAAAPVVREPMPVFKMDPRRFWNLMSLTDKRQHIADHVQATGEPMLDPLLQCNCCGQHVTIIGKQVWSPKQNRKDSILVECRNPDCIARHRTSSVESHHQICEDARREAEQHESAKQQSLKQEQAQYAHARSQYWLERVSDFRQRGKEHIKSARAAQRKSQYWLHQLDKLEAAVNG